MRITASTTRKLHDFAFRLAARRRERGRPGHLTCVDKANVFKSQAFFRTLFDEVATRHPQVETSYSYVDAMALDMVRRPWDFDVMVMENMFGDILSISPAVWLVAWGWPPAARSAMTMRCSSPHTVPPRTSREATWPILAAILSGAMMLDYLADRCDLPAYEEAARLIETAVEDGFAANAVRPMEFGGDMGCVLDQNHS